MLQQDIKGLGRAFWGLIAPSPVFSLHPFVLSLQSLLPLPNLRPHRMGELGRGRWPGINYLQTLLLTKHVRDRH